MIYLYQRKDGMWCGKLKEQGATIYKYSKDKNMAYQKAYEELRKIQRGEKSYSKTSFGNFYDMWFRIYSDSLSPSTIRSYRFLAKHFMPEFKNRELCSIKPLEIQSLVNDFRLEHGEKTTKNLIGFIHKLFECAIENDLLDRNPCRNIKVKRGEKYQYRLLTENELTVLLNSVRTEREELILLLGGFLGVRRGEMAALTWEDIDFENQTISIHNTVVIDSNNKRVTKKCPKTESGVRSLKIPKYCFERLKNLKKKGRIFGDIHPGRLYDTFLNLQNRVFGHQITRLHDLRHFNATLMLKAGIPDKVAAARLGHSNTNMTKKYQHILSDMDDDASEKINERIGL